MALVLLKSQHFQTLQMVSYDVFWAQNSVRKLNVLNKGPPLGGEFQRVEWMTSILKFGQVLFQESCSGSGQASIRTCCQPPSKC